ncbi:MAG: YggT family protein [Methylophilaceae bacterium]|nr:YggT family protein [Methylophilaceae bacterium]MDG1444987.1 YggT family protein [Methylophilaceae bacterium]MDG2293918.1 YggT family protein [Methylophilaceae bacterium]
MIQSATHFLLSTIFSLLTMVFLLRFMMQILKTSFYNPIGQIVIALTDFAVKPARRYIPSWKKNDLSTLVLAFAAQFLLHLTLLGLSGFPFAVADVPVWPSILGLSLLGVIRTVFDIFFYALILHVILSWVNPHSPIAPVLHSLARPILDPIQRIIPSMGGIDFSPMIAILLLQMLNVSVLNHLARSMASML